MKNFFKKVEELGAWIEKTLDNAANYNLSSKFKKRKDEKWE